MTERFLNIFCDRHFKVCMIKIWAFSEDFLLALYGHWGQSNVIGFKMCFALTWSLMWATFGVLYAHFKHFNVRLLSYCTVVQLFASVIFLNASEIWKIGVLLVYLVDWDGFHSFNHLRVFLVWIGHRFRELNDLKYITLKELLNKICKKIGKWNNI